MSSADPTIIRVNAREVLDSRGRPTVEVEVTCRDGARGRAITPSGASTGRHEAVELRDGDPTRYGGKGVRKAVANVRELLTNRLLGLSATDQARVDRILCEIDGTPDKSRAGANAILGVSMAIARAAAASQGVPLWRRLDPDGLARLPLPMVNLISGGLHAGGNLDFQDFLLLPIGARTYSEALEMSVAVYRALSDVLTRHGFEGVLVGDEGGFGPRLHGNEQAVELILEAIAAAGFVPGKDAALAIDVASTHFYRDGRYHLRLTTEESGLTPSPLAGEGWGGGLEPLKSSPPTPTLPRKGGGSKKLTSEEMTTLLKRWSDTYPIFSIEDGLAEDDWDGWRNLTAALGGRVQLIGDDLFATNPARLKRGIDEGVANCVLVKVNQIGTLTETLAVVRMAREAGYRAVISARSGETEDSFLADLAVATGAGQIKIGSVARSERLAKYNQLLRIEEEMGASAPFAGWRPV